MELSSIRRDFTGARLVESACPVEPWPLFEAWLREAVEHSILDATAMTVCTVSPVGRANCRIVLLKAQDRRGLVFFTRYTSRKGADLSHDPNGSLLFHWRELNRQIRMAVHFERLSKDESAAYFATRPRESQLAARAASGLGRIEDGAVLERRYAAEADKWQDADVPMPEDWGGYRGTPSEFEFWQGRPGRLHDRLVYTLKDDGGWERYRLAP